MAFSSSKIYGVGNMKDSQTTEELDFDCAVSLFRRCPSDISRDHLLTVMRQYQQDWMIKKMVFCPKCGAEYGIDEDACVKP
jgi:hypothetical protein